jgi:parvulin-like peptidyl-prolyl isomerase
MDRSKQWIAFVVCCAVLWPMSGLATEREVVEAILARVNDRVITVSEFAKRVQQDAAQLDPPPAPEDLGDFAAALLDNVVNEMVLLERAVEKGVTVDEEILDGAIDNLRAEAGLEDEATFREALAQSMMTEEDLRNRYRRSFMIQRASQGETQPTELTEEELRVTYEAERDRYAVPEKIELEQLVFPVAEDGGDFDDVLRRAQSMLGRVSEGSDLKAEATLAGVELQSLGGIPVEDLRPELRERLDGVPEGGFTEPMENPGGIVVLRVIDRIPAGFREFDEVREQIRRREAERLFFEARQGFVDRLKGRYLVEVHEERLGPIVARLVGNG